MYLDKISKLGRYFLAIPMIVFGIQHFVYADFVVGLVPVWIPGGLFWTYFTGLALIAAGIGILFNVLTGLAATLLGLMIFSWVVLLHIPRALMNEGNTGEFINIFNALTMGAGALILAHTYNGEGYLKRITTVGARVGSFLIVCSLMVFGVEHLIHGKLVFIVGAAPFAIPAELFWVYLSAIVFISAAIAMFVTARSGRIAVLVGIFMFIITLLFYVPEVLTSIYWSHTLSTLLKGVAMSGSAMLYSHSPSASRTKFSQTAVVAKNS